MKNTLINLLFVGISAFALNCFNGSVVDNVDYPIRERSDTIIVNFEYGEDFSESKWKNIYVIWMEDTTSGFLQNISVCQKLITGGITGIALPYWKMNKYPLSSKDEIDAVTSATQANADFSVSAVLKDSKIRNFDLYLEVDRSFEPNDWFTDQPSLLYSVNVNLDDSTSEYELIPIGWTPNESAQNKIPNTPIGQLQKEMKYITNHKVGLSFGDADERSATKMVKKITASIKKSVPTSLITENKSICEGQTYKGWSTEGQYTETLTSVLGSDSVVITNLTVNPIYEISEDIVICNGEKYKGWTEPGQHIENLISISGCDSIVTTNLIVNSVFNITENKTICEGQTYKGWSTEGQYTETLTSVLGCDSIVTTNLSFYLTYQPDITVKNDTLISSNFYLSYQWCDKNGEIPGEINKECIISKSGEYHLIVVDDNGCTNISNPLLVVYSSVNSNLFNNFKYTIIPNPNMGKFTFRIDSNPLNKLTLKLANSIGQIIEVRKVISSEVNHTEQFDVSHLSKGNYYLIIKSDEFYTSEKIIFQ